jgi:hypothetical protein
MKSTQQVLEHHLQAFGEGVDSIVSDYDEHASIITPQGTFRGLTEIRAFLSAFVAGIPKGFDDAFKLTKMEVIDEVAYIEWEANPWSPMGTDTFIVRDGKILCQTFATYSSGK